MTTMGAGTLQAVDGRRIRSKQFVALSCQGRGEYAVRP